MSEICKICEGVSCVNPPDLNLYSLQNSSLYNAQYIFLVECPPGYFCPAGLFPKYVTIKKNRKVIVFPPAGATSISVQGCQSLIVVNIPAGSSTTAITALMQSALLQWAAQQAICDSIVDEQLQSKSTYYFNELVSVGCDGDKLINLIGDDYIIPSAVYVDGGKLWMKAGSMVRDSVALANTAATEFLTDLMASLVASGNLQCGYFNTEQSFTCPDTTVITVPANQFFSTVSQEAANEEALTYAETQCPGQTGLNFNDLGWFSTSFQPGSTASWVGNTFTGSGSVSPPSSAAMDGQGGITYTGVAVDCNIHMEIPSFTGCPYVYCYVFINGNLEHAFEEYTGGTFDFPFTIPDSVETYIEIWMGGQIGFGACEIDSSLNCTVTATPAF